MQNDAVVDLSHSTSRKDFIFKIPRGFEMHNEEPYKPYKFSIGPWHRGKTPGLRTGKKLKESFFKGLINRFSDPTAKKRELEEAIREVHGKARGCYEEGDVYDKRHRKYFVKCFAERKFEKILLLDGCFIIELFRKKAEIIPTRENESIYFSAGMIQDIYHDLLLLENQIPWFVLELLFNRTNNGCTRFTLVELVIKFFGRAIPHYGPQELGRLQWHNLNIIHLVHFVWHFLCFSSETERLDRELNYETPIPSVTRLKEAGVKFQKAESRNILDVRFNNGVLEMPPLLITPSTETIFRNLIIFEQCSHLCKLRVTCYAVLLDYLVDTSDDVDLMSRAEILNSCLNSQDTANFLNNIRRYTSIQEFLYAKLCKDVNRYCERRWPRWRAALIQNYFTKPWAIVSAVFAVVILIFTIMQVFYKQR